MSFFHTTEFYVILFLVAMAIVAFLAKPHTSGPATEMLLGASLSASGEGSGRNNSSANDNGIEIVETADALPEPEIIVDCDDSGCVWLRRTALDGVDASGAVSAKVVVKGTNITVYERIVPGRYGDSPVDTAIFDLDFLAPERYYLRYESEATNRTATLSFRNTPGYHTHAHLKQ